MYGFKIVTPNHIYDTSSSNCMTLSNGVYTGPGLKKVLIPISDDSISINIYSKFTVSVNLLSAPSTIVYGRPFNEGISINAYHTSLNYNNAPSYIVYTSTGYCKIGDTIAHTDGAYDLPDLLYESGFECGAAGGTFHGGAKKLLFLTVTVNIDHVYDNPGTESTYAPYKDLVEYSIIVNKEVE